MIRGIHPGITEQRLREDLDHIHNLVIINISYQNGDAFLSLNSVHNALFARTCMMSRGLYKGMRIEWYADECAQPLPRSNVMSRKENSSPAKPTPPRTINRFQMLNMDGTETSSDDDESDDGNSDPTLLSSRLSAVKLSPRAPWSDRIIAA